MLSNFMSVPPKFIIPFGNGQGITFYAFFIFIGIIAATVTVYIKFRKNGLNADYVFYFAIPLIPIVIFGARLWYVLSNLENFPTFGSFFGFNNGGFQGLSGLAIQGGVTFGLIFGLAFFWFLLRKKQGISLLLLFDIIIPTILIGQVFGRWGNFFNQEVLGKTVSESMVSGFVFKDWLHYPDDPVGTYRLPLFFIESMLNLGAYVVISLFGQRIFRKPGVAGSMYFVWYGVLRASLEMLREERDIMRINGVPVSLVFSILFAVAGLAFAIWCYFFRERYMPNNELFYGYEYTGIKSSQIKKSSMGKIATQLKSKDLNPMKEKDIIETEMEIEETPVDSDKK